MRFLIYAGHSAFVWDEIQKIFFFRDFHCGYLAKRVPFLYDLRMLTVMWCPVMIYLLSSPGGRPDQARKLPVEP